MFTKSVVSITFFLAVVSSDPTLEKLFLQHEVIPDVLSTAPDGFLKVKFPSGAEAQLGNELSIRQVEGIPTLEWDYQPNLYYTVIFLDADPRSRADPDDPSFVHWLVVNVPGAEVAAGSSLVPLLNSHPEPGTGLHRYIFLVYRQPGVVDFHEAFDSFELRKGFSPQVFADKFELGNAIAGNFYQTQNLGDKGSVD